MAASWRRQRPRISTTRSMAACSTAMSSASDRLRRPTRAIRSEMIAAGQTDGSILAEAAPEDLYDAIYGSLFYRYVFGLGPITPAYARNQIRDDRRGPDGWQHPGGGSARGSLRRDLWQPVLPLCLRHRTDHAGLRAQSDPR